MTSLFQMSAVDRSFCENRCFERGLCIKMEELYYCLCDDEAGDCTGRTTTAASVPAAELSNEDVVLLAAVGGYFTRDC
ncbi:hypothetical protein Y032_0067g94 [Ancylostoma ceylanicum]|nr:hypothetical protein Y032_0067g94 [Ancylostoma ceylanicum]